MKTNDEGAPPITGPGYPRARAVLRILGPTLAAAAVVLILIGGASFFAAFATREFPRNFWCMFLGMPLLFVGILLSAVGYAGVAQRYMAGEVAPVQKDTINYLARGTRGSARGLARAIGEGLTAGFVGGSTCPRCKRAVPTGSSFCPHCGVAMRENEPS